MFISGPNVGLMDIKNKNKKHTVYFGPLLLRCFCSRLTDGMVQASVKFKKKKSKEKQGLIELYERNKI